jgi:aldehyde:ferredoxin oxidoreductase
MLPVIMNTVSHSIEDPPAGDDKLPERFYQPTNGGPLANLKVDREGYEKARKFYDVLTGWYSNGVPLPEKVAEFCIA